MNMVIKLSALIALAGGAGMAQAQASVTPLPASGAFDYQLDGRYTPAADVAIVSSDPRIGRIAAASSAQDVPLDTRLYNICYLNVFQTQPDESASWLATHRDLILMSGDQPVHDDDPDWQGELLFDVSTSLKQTKLLELQRGWISACKAAGYKAIEPDNIDSYTRSRRMLTAEQAQAYMTLFAAEAHAQGMAVAQKNVTTWVREAGADGKLRAQSVGFDFAIVEECQVAGDCNEVIGFYTPARVLEIEYLYDEDNDSAGVEVPAFSKDHFYAACKARGNSIRIVLRNRDVRPASAAGYVRETCGAATAPAEMEPRLPGEPTFPPPTEEPAEEEPGPGPQQEPGDDEPDDEPVIAPQRR